MNSPAPTTLDFDERFTDVSERHLDELALVMPDSRFTFSELDARSRALRPVLLELFERSGVSHLPLVVDYSTESYLAVFTCVRFGIPCGLVDGLAPAQRIVAMLKLWGSPSTAWLGPMVTTLDQHAWDESLGQPNAAYTRNNLGTELADSVVITTSGSTGFPKGVEIPFDTLMVRARLDPDRGEFGSGRARISNVSPLHFVGGLNRLLKIFLGHEIHVFRPQSVGVREFLRQLEGAKLTHLSLPPQVGRLLAGYANPDQVFFDTVQQLRMGSEGVRFEILEGLKKYFPSETVFSHGLGATEGSRAFRWESPLSEIPSTGQVPVGLPEKRIRLVPTEGVPDGFQEVWVSETIARGYLNRPEMTNERFVTDEDGIRWWRSGDLVEQGADGLYYHRGRMDDIVKVRGILASPFETTRMLLNMTEVRMAITLPVSASGNIRLESHVELKESETSVTPSHIMTRLESVLPDHLIPSRIWVHESLPTNGRGKIDRHRLAKFMEADKANGTNTS